MDRREKIINAIDINAEKIRMICRYLYENPEIGLQEYKSSKKLASFLRDEGFEVEDEFCDMKTAFKATLKSGDGAKIALLAEYDALPGMGHACGHHMIASMSIAAALGLKSIISELGGEISVIGTPSEETGDGKARMAEAGVFDSYDAAMMIHPNSTTEIYPEMIAIGGIDFRFTGRAAHAGSSPYEGINALDAVVLFYNNINALRQQLKDGTRVHGIILEAGSAANIIPDNGRVRMEFRAKEQSYFDEVVGKCIKCAEAAALATGCTLKYHHFEPTCQGMKHNKVLGEQFKTIMEEFGIYEDERKAVGSSDIGNVSNKIPTIHPMLKICDEERNVHTAEFKEATMEPFAQETMIKGAKILALTGLKLAEDKNFLNKVKQEFADR